MQNLCLQELGLVPQLRLTLLDSRIQTAQERLVQLVLSGNEPRSFQLNTNCKHAEAARLYYTTTHIHADTYRA